MQGFLKFVGRMLQLIALLALPSAIWVAEIQKSEAGAVTIFLGSLGAFFVGWIFTKAG